MTFSPFLSIDHSCDETLQWSMNQLTQIGLRPIQTFDLHSARAGLHDSPCPIHGTEDCDCQMAVVLVYGNAESPETLILHGSGEKTWMSITDKSIANTTGSLAELIKDTLINQKFIKVRTPK